MGDLNTHSIALAPTMEGQLLCMSADKVLNTYGHALLSLLTPQELQILSSTIQLSHQATSLWGPGPSPSYSVVDYAITSHTAVPWAIGVTVDNAWPTLSDHCPLMLSLASLSPVQSGSSLPTLLAC